MTSTVDRARRLLLAYRAEIHRSYVVPSSGQVEDPAAARDIAELDEVIAAIAAPHPEVFAQCPTTGGACDQHDQCAKGCRRV